MNGVELGTKVSRSVPKMLDCLISWKLIATNSTLLFMHSNEALILYHLTQLIAKTWQHYTFQNVEKCPGQM